jgi:DNA polymerase-3 subunit delta
MMAPRRVVLVFQADSLLAPKRESETATRALGEIEAFLQNPEKQTTVVLVAGSIDRRGRVFKQLQKHATLVECGSIESQADAERWVRNRVVAAGAQIEPAAARLLAERGGTDLKRLRNDVERLLLYALGQKTITLGDARELAGPAALQDHWAMSNAVEAGDAASALRQLTLLLDAGIQPVMILGQLGAVVRSRFAPAALRRSVDALFRTDLELKTSGGEARVLLERLVVELCAWRQRPAARM